MDLLYWNITRESLVKNTTLMFNYQIEFVIYTFLLLMHVNYNIKNLSIKINFSLLSTALLTKENSSKIVMEPFPKKKRDSDESSNRI
jgi:hypothetical protein